MKKALVISLFATITGIASAAPNFTQDPFTGNNAWGPCGDLNFQDDLIIDSGTWDISAINMFEYWGDGDTYTVNIFDNYIDLGGNLLYSASTPESSLIFDGGLGGYVVPFATPGLILGPGTYIVQLDVSDGVFGGDYYWFNANVGGPNGNEAYIDGVGGSSAWAGESFDMSWDMDATLVPEPATMAVMGLGLLAVVRRRK